MRMWRFILVSFAFLGWSFYELSGGADYEPRINSIQARAKLDDLRPKARPADPQRADERRIAAASTCAPVPARNMTGSPGLNAASRSRCCAPPAMAG